MLISVGLKIVCITLFTGTWAYDWRGRGGGRNKGHVRLNSNKLSSEF